MYRTHGYVPNVDDLVGTVGSSSIEPTNTMYTTNTARSTATEPETVQQPETGGGLTIQETADTTPAKVAKTEPKGNEFQVQGFNIKPGDKVQMTTASFQDKWVTAENEAQILNELGDQKIVNVNGLNADGSKWDGGPVGGFTTNEKFDVDMDLR